MDIKACIELKFNDDGYLEGDPFAEFAGQCEGLTDLFIFVHGMNSSVSAAEGYRKALMQALTAGAEVAAPNRKIGLCAVAWNGDSGTAHWHFLTKLRPRAVKIGEVGLAPFLSKLARHRLQGRGDALRMHLVAHSTGTVVAAHTLASVLGAGADSPVKSVFLLQGVLPVNVFATGTFGDSDVGRILGKLSAEGLHQLAGVATLGASGSADLRNRLVKGTGALARREIYADGPIVATKSFTDDNLAALAVIPGEELPIGREGFFAVDSQEFELGPLGASYSFSSRKFSELNIRPEVGKDHNACLSSPSIAWANLMAAGLLSGSMITPLGGDAWADTRAMTSVDGSLYVIQNGKLWRANPADGSYTQLGGQDWQDTAAMTSIGGSLYVIQNGKLWRASPADGSYTQLGGQDWQGTAAMTGLGGSLYVIQNGKLWRVNPGDGTYTQLGGQDWQDTAAMTSIGGSLYVIQNGKLWRVNPGDGSYTQLGGQDWNNTAAMTAGPEDKLYAVQNGKLWRTNPEDGKYDRLHADIWKSARAMAFVDRRLYLIHDNRLWQVKLAAAV